VPDPKEGGLVGRNHISLGPLHFLLFFCFLSKEKKKRVEGKRGMGRKYLPA